MNSGVLRLDALDSPLRMDAGDAVRIGKSRVTLDVVVEEYESGKTPEDIVRAYDSLNIADVYGAIYYYLSRRAEVAEYLARRAEEAARLRAQVEAGRSPLLRDELVTRPRATEQDHAATGQ